MTLLAAFVALVAATLVHHAHNAQFLAHYPNLPAWITPAVVYLAWIGATAIGTAGYVLQRRGYRRLGLGLLALYACYGLDSLLHYARAPMSAHSAGMNATIWFEAAAGAALLVACLATRGRPLP